MLKYYWSTDVKVIKTEMVDDCEQLIPPLTGTMLSQQHGATTGSIYKVGICCRFVMVR